jgi:hypothetical protein
MSSRRDTLTNPNSSAWARQFSTPAQLLLLPASANQTHVSQTSQILATADVPVIVCDPATSEGGWDDVKQLTRSLFLSRGIVVVLGASGPHVPSPPEGPEQLQIRVVDPWRAEQALAALREASGENSGKIGKIGTSGTSVDAANAVQRFQDDFNGSQISAVTQAIKSHLGHSSDSDSTKSLNVASIRVQTTLNILQSALAQAEQALWTSRAEVVDAFQRIDAAREELGREREEARKGVFGTLQFQSTSIVPPLAASEQAKAGKDVHTHTAALQAKDSVGQSLEAAEKIVRETMDRLVWWKLLYKVSEVDYTVTSAVAGSWFRDLEPEVEIISTTIM